MQAMETDIAPRGAAPLNLGAWRDFQGGLADLLGMNISLYDSAGKLLSTSGKDNCVCSAIKDDRGGRSRCRRQYEKAVAQAVREKKVHVYKCHANQFIFAAPVVTTAARPGYVVTGGRLFIEGTEFRDFYEAMTPYGLASADLVRLKNGMKTIPRGSIFTVPTTVSNLAGPYLRSLVTAPCRDVAEASYGKGFHALDEVYKAIAPVLDREELYQTILEKSVELLGAETGSLMIVDYDEEVLSIKAAMGLEVDLASSVRIPLGEGISGFIAAKGLPMVVRDVELEVARKNRERYKTGSFISIPLKLDSRVIGVINVTDKLTGEVFSDEDLALLLSFANYASIALERGAYYSMTEELKLLSMTDPLTGLFNRRYFRERLYEEAERVKRHDECFSTFVIDIDNFKAFNDRYGHLAGDEVLRDVSRAIRDAVRSMDVVARYGGEEFAVILPHTGKTSAFEIAERVRRGVELIASEKDSYTNPLTISVGVAEFPRDAGTIDDLIDRADRAMYRAKNSGKNQVVVYDGSSGI